MVNIQVPITQKDKFGFARSQPEPKITEKTANSDLEFLKQLADQGRLVTATGSRTTTGTLAEIIPQNGETFYLIDAQYNFDSSSALATIELRNDGTVKSIITSPGTPIVGFFAVKFDSLVGNGVKQYDVLVTDVGTTTADVTINGYLLPSETVSSRGSG